jgi:hypothetical protein
MISLRAAGSMPGLDRVTRPAPVRAAASAHSDRRPSIPGLPATTRTAPFHLCASTAERATRRPRRRRVHEVLGRTRHVESDVGDDDHPTQLSSAPNTSPGFKAWNVTVRVAESTPGQLRRSTRSTPLGMSTASTGGAAPGRHDVGRDPIASEAGAVGGVDHQIARRQHRRPHRRHRSPGPSRPDARGTRRRYVRRCRCCPPPASTLTTRP